MNEREYPGACKLAGLTPDELRNTIVRKEKLSPTITRMEIRAPLIARAAKAGQFVMVWVGEKSERVPLTICDWDVDKGTITIIFQEVGFSTKELGRLEEGEDIASIAGPLGKPTEIDNFGTAVVVGGGVGTAIAYPIAKSLKKANNKLIVVVGAREKSLVLLENEMRKIADELIITTDDGSYGRKGLVTDALSELLESQKVDMVFAAGPLPMMKAVAMTTQPYGVKTIVSLDPIMIDGTGMCGGCRVTVGRKTMFTCVDGPDFDAHQVDWDELRARKAYYFDEENKANANALVDGAKK
ncbi:MAG: sulfide/dihydroorotate dehydrogenase-like FAD/NAD-binding protein [Armatimonadota bacterium]|nr:sulfide/dihydroorotate dehydrogenase-like FAD/NAD-binding protein [Armatimonadota bacterium]